MNKAGYTAQDALGTRMEITGNGRTDGRTDTPSYRNATANLKTIRGGREMRTNEVLIDIGLVEAG